MCAVKSLGGCSVLSKDKAVVLERLFSDVEVVQVADAGALGVGGSRVTLVGEAGGGGRSFF